MKYSPGYIGRRMFLIYTMPPGSGTFPLASNMSLIHGSWTTARSHTSKSLTIGLTRNLSRYKQTHKIILSTSSKKILTAFPLIKNKDIMDFFCYIGTTSAPIPISRETALLGGNIRQSGSIHESKAIFSERKVSPAIVDRSR